MQPREGHCAQQNRLGEAIVGWWQKRHLQIFEKEISWCREAVFLKPKRKSKKRGASLLLRASETLHKNTGLGTFNRAVPFHKCYIFKSEPLSSLCCRHIFAVLSSIGRQIRSYGTSHYLCDYGTGEYCRKMVLSLRQDEFNKTDSNDKFFYAQHHLQYRHFEPPKTISPTQSSKENSYL